MSKRAVLYARVSGDDRGNATSSIEGQLNDCRNYAGSKGYQVVNEFSEDAEKLTSGADWLPEIDRVIKLAHQGAFDVLIALKMDRLARNRFKQLSIENGLNRAGVAVEYAGQQFDDTAEGRLLKGLMGEFAEFERETIRDRMVRGMLRSVEAGNVKISNRPPYGYRVVVNEAGRRVLVIIEEEAVVIRLIFDLYVNHRYTIYAIEKYLAKHKIPTPAGGKVAWSHAALHNILTNETYIGRWYYGKSRGVKDERTGKIRRVATPPAEWILVQVPPIINEAIFQAAKRRSEANKTQGKYRKHIYTLGGMLTCGHCGHSMAGLTPNEKNRYYVCNKRHGGARYGTATLCTSPYYNLVEVETTIWQWVKGILLSPEQLQRALESHQERQAAALEPVIRMVEANKAKRAELEQQKERLIAAYTTGVLSLDEIATQKTQLDKQISDLTAAIQEFEAELSYKVLSKQQVETIESYAVKIRLGADLTDHDPANQRQIFQLLNLEVTLSSDDDGRRWADVSCILGEESLSTIFIPTACGCRKN
ncbi:MAG: recombinase family protein [Chloroflexi bacterium]|nr:recombinase family protein [Chloroflexota bacterium]MCI0648596.1 recombinase family protein [Chloroflexota bacterium]MCI0729805.1 recombinase family protein [Chloroflexota bacterium]